MLWDYYAYFNVMLKLIEVDTHNNTINRDYQVDTNIPRI